MPPSLEGDAEAISARLKDSTLGKHRFGTLCRISKWELKNRHYPRYPWEQQLSEAAGTLGSIKLWAWGAMGSENTICPYLAAMDVLPAQLSCSCEASSWSFSVLPGQHDARAASRGLLHTLPWQCPVTEDRIPVIVKKWNGRREHYPLEIGGTGCPIGSIRLHEAGVIVVLFHLTSAVHGPGGFSGGMGDVMSITREQPLFI